MRNVLLILFLFLANLSDAQVVFDKSYGGLILNRFGRNIELANNNGYLINASLGTPYMNTVLYRINAVGDTLWTRRFGNDSIQYKTYEMVKRSNGNYLLCGDYQHVNDPFSMDSYLMEVDSLGHTVWFNEYGLGNSVGGKDYANNVLEFTNGNIVTTGEAKHSFTEIGTVQNYNLFQGYVSLFDSVGDSLRTISLIHYFSPSSQTWSHHYHCSDAAVSNDRICIVGERYLHIQPTFGDTSFALILDENLDTVRCVYFPINRSLCSVDVTPQGTFIVFGDDILAEIDSNGNLIWQRQIPLIPYGHTKVGVRQNGEIVVLQSADGAGIPYDVTPLNGNGMVFIHTLDNVGNEIYCDTLSLMPSAYKGMADFILEGDSIITLTGENGLLRTWIVQYNGRGHGMTNIHTVFDPKGLSVFPNPTQDAIYVTGASTNSQFTILNSVGQVVLFSKFDNDLGKIDISEMAPGLYLIQICDESGRLSGTSFIKQ